MKRLTNLITLCTLLFLAACTPKAPTTETTEPSTPPVKQPVVNEKLSPCPKFTDAPNPGQVEDNYVIYRDFLRAGDVPKAYELWQTVYEVAPAADGRRNTVITDGIYFMEVFMSQTTDLEKRKEYEDKVFEFYDKIQECYPEGGYVPARKGFDGFYKYPNRYTKKELYDLFRESIEIDGNKAGDFILNPFTNLAVELHEQKVITDAQAKEDVTFILNRLDLGKASAKTADERERWAIIDGYVPQRLTYFEQIPGFFDCEYFKEKYAGEFEESSDDYTRLLQVAGYLKFGGCTDSDPVLQQFLQRAKAIKPVEPPSTSKNSCFTLIQDGKYREAVDCLEDSYNASTDPEKKAQYALVIAKLYYGSIRNFSSSRSWARKAAQDKGGWGDPYILIGKLYASSGPLCGSGTGFESQRVVWVAIDQWNKAKSIDSNSASEANKLINKYAQYMPSADDGFMNGLKPGQSYTVPCWINESTTVRYK